MEEFKVTCKWLRVVAGSLVLPTLVCQYANVGAPFGVTMGLSTAFLLTATAGTVGWGVEACLARLARNRERREAAQQVELEQVRVVPQVEIVPQIETLKEKCLRAITRRSATTEVADNLLGEFYSDPALIRMQQRLYEVGFRRSEASTRRLVRGQDLGRSKDHSRSI